MLGQFKRTCVLASLAVVAFLNGCEGPPPDDANVPVTEGFPLFGPGPHWIDGVGSGTVTFDAVAFVEVDLNGDGVADFAVEVRGHTTVFRSAAQRADPADPRHRNHLDLEIIDLVLEANGIRFQAGDGVGNFGADGPLFSIGTSTEVPGSPQLAHDDFAIYFEGEIGGVALHNGEPLRMVAAIDRLPPIDNTFIMDGDPLPLLNEAGEPAGVQITAVTYTPREPGSESNGSLPMPGASPMPP